MEDQQKSRLIILLAALLVLGGGVGAWVWYQNSQAEKADLETAQIGANQTTAQTNAQQTNPNLAGSSPDNTKVGTTETGATPGSDSTQTNSTSQAASNPTQIAQANPNPTPAPVATPTAPAGLVSNSSSPSVAINDKQVSSKPVGKYPATKREEAVAEAKQVAGRNDPMQATLEHALFPEYSKGLISADSPAGNDLKVPPPPPAEKISSSTHDKLAPPPPPLSTGGGNSAGGFAPAGGIASQAELDPSALPVPPEKPLVAQFLKLTAIVGNKAVLSVPYNLRLKNKWPSVICLGPGERFEDSNTGAISVVSVDPDSVTIDEEGERSVKNLPSIK